MYKCHYKSIERILPPSPSSASTSLGGGEDVHNVCIIIYIILCVRIVRTTVCAVYWKIPRRHRFVMGFSLSLSFSLLFITVCLLSLFVYIILLFDGGSAGKSHSTPSKCHPVTGAPDLRAVYRVVTHAHVQVGR